MLANDGIGQVQQLIERVEWLYREYNFGAFTDVPDNVKRKIVEELVDKIIVGHTIEIRLKLPNPKLTKTVVSHLHYDVL
jgi:hypothetical protein